ncbi:ABC transporter permease [Terriglobus aquaticus]|uniref:ABC transporter permease n=1 Tax=Terriglobus aquaticus TaxID=940139 RepID=A0ABW9KM90_9BACT|nr:ABC transporter permease [Terriglobus aquaticus]
MGWQEGLKLAMQSLWANKLRTLLTLLGVVIGVAAVIAVVTLVNGANAYVATKVNTYGADVMTVSKEPGFNSDYNLHLQYLKRKNIDLDQYRYLSTECHNCDGLGAQQTTRGKVVVGKQSSTDTVIRGNTWMLPTLQNQTIVEGRGFTPADDDHASHVALIGSDIQENLLGGEDPIGKEIRVDGTTYTVIGLGEKQGKSLGQSQDNWVTVPLSTYQKTYGTAKTVTIYVKAGGGKNGLERTEDEVRLLMRAARHDRPGQEDSFTIETSDTFIALWKNISSGFEAVAVAIAAISLVVGGIVIMNIMLVSVTERTREIGVRKALGARRRDVLMQFLMESAAMALVGGIIGVIGGAAVAQGVTVLLGFPSSFAVWSAIAGMLVAVSVGIFFGVYPARKAAMLDPIEALRAD